MSIVVLGNTTNPTSGNNGTIFLNVYGGMVDPIVTVGQMDQQIKILII